MRKINDKYLSAIGIALKEKRIKFQLTLESVSKGICCVSYLSKLENGKLSPDLGILKALFTKLSINLDEVIELYEACDLSISMNALFELDIFYLEKVYEKIINKAFAIKAELIKSMYYLVSENYVSLEKSLKELDIFKSMFDKDELYAFKYLNMEYNIKTSKLMVAKTISKTVSYEEIENKRLAYLLYEQQFHLNYYLDEKEYITENYEDLKKVTFEWVPIKRTLLNELILLEYKTSLSKKLKGFEKDTTLEKILTNLDTNCWYYYLKALINLNKYEEVIKKIEENKLDSPQMMAILAMAHFYLKDVEKTKAFEERVKSYVFEKKDLVHKNFIYYLLLKMNNRTEELNKALKKELISFAIFSYNKFYNNFYREDYSVYLLKHSKYKEAASFFRKFM